MSFILTHYAVQLGLETKKEMVQAQKDTRGMIEKILVTDWTDATFYISMGIFISIIILAAFLVTIILVYITYRNFNIRSTDHEIEITYGLINKRHFHISRSNIRSLRIEEPLLYRVLGYAKIKADNIGLNNKASKSLFIMPIVKKDSIYSIINQYTPDFKNEKIEFYPSRQVLPIFLFKSVIWVIVTLIGLTVVSKYALFGFLLLPIWIMLGFMKWRHSGLSFTSLFITNSFSAGLTKTTLITKKKYIESTGVAQTFIQKRYHTADYQYAVYSEKLIEVYDCFSISVNQRKDFLEYLHK